MHSRAHNNNKLFQNLHTIQINSPIHKEFTNKEIVNVTSKHDLTLSKKNMLKTRLYILQISY